MSKEVATLMVAILLFPLVAWAKSPAETVRQAVLQEYSGARIGELEALDGEHKGIWEVEFTLHGEEYEAFVTESGEIKKVEKDDGPGATFGIGLFHETSIYRGTKSEREASPILFFEHGKFELSVTDGLRAFYDLSNKKNGKLSLFGFLRMDEGFEIDESAYLRGMDETSPSFELGFRYTVEKPFGEIWIDFLRDVSSEHEGNEFSLSFVKEEKVGSFFIRPMLKFSYQSSEMTNYFYGVSPAEVRADRPAYSGDSDLNISLKAVFRRPINERFAFAGLVEYIRYGSEVTNSPLVDEDHSLQFAIGGLFSF